jgi:hypothetical protein
MFKNLLIVIVVDLERSESIYPSFSEWLTFINATIIHKFSELEVSLSNEVKTHFEKSIVRHRVMFANPNENEVVDPAIYLESMNVDSFLGLPLLIVANKADALASLSEEDSHYVQHSLRRLAVKYGASLIYTSAKQNVNLKTLYNYLGYIMLHNDTVLPKVDISRPNEIFVPLGFDTIENLEQEFPDFNNYFLKKKRVLGSQANQAQEEAEEIVEPADFFKNLKDGKLMYYNPDKDNLGPDTARRTTVGNQRRSIFEQPRSRILEVIGGKGK